MVFQSYEVYTDGACTNNQGAGMQPGGWGVVFTDGRKFSGGTKETTNNRMELTAVIEALKNTVKESQVIIYSDSAYVINAFTQNWIRNWMRNGWKTSQGKPVENQDLWKALIPLVQERTVKWVKVKGHSGNPLNELADKLAVQAIGKTGKQNQEQPVEQTVQLLLRRESYELLMQKLTDLAKTDSEVKELLSVLKNN